MVNLTSIKLRVNNSPLARRPLNRSEGGVNSTSSCPMLLSTGILEGGVCINVGHLALVYMNV